MNVFKIIHELILSLNSKNKVLESKSNQNSHFLKRKFIFFSKVASILKKKNNNKIFWIPHIERHNKHMNLNEPIYFVLIQIIHTIVQCFLLLHWTKTYIVNIYFLKFSFSRFKFLFSCIVLFCTSFMSFIIFWNIIVFLKSTFIISRKQILIIIFNINPLRIWGISYIL